MLKHRMSIVPKTMWGLMPIDPAFNHVRDTLLAVANKTGFHFERADHTTPRRRMSESFLQGIHGSDLLVVDLSGWNPNVLYELGVADSLSIPYILVCRRSADPIPFYFRDYLVIYYDDNEMGLLAARLETQIKSDVSSYGPAFDAFKPIRQKLVRTQYLFWGACVGALLAGLASAVTAPFGSVSTVFSNSKVLGTVIGNSLGGFSLGASTFYAHAWFCQRMQHARSNLVQGAHLLVVGVAGIANAGVSAAFVYGLNRELRGSEIAWSVAAIYFTMLSLQGVALGLLLSVGTSSDEPPTLGRRIAWSVLVFTAIYLVFYIGVESQAAQRWVFRPEFLTRYEPIALHADVARFTFWGIAMSALEWHLRWNKKVDSRVLPRA